MKENLWGCLVMVENKRDFGETHTFSLWATKKKSLQIRVITGEKMAKERGRWQITKCVLPSLCLCCVIGSVLFLFFFLQRVFFRFSNTDLFFLIIGLSIFFLLSKNRIFFFFQRVFFLLSNCVVFI